MQKLIPWNKSALVFRAADFGEEQGSKREERLSHLTGEKRNPSPKDPLKMQRHFCSRALGIMLLLTGLGWASCVPSTEKEAPPPTEVAAPMPEAISLAGQELFPPKETAAGLAKKDSLLQIAQRNFAADSTNLDNIIWLGRRLAYLSRYREAISVFTAGLQIHPDSPKLYRHRGHRYLSTRKFDLAIADFAKAAERVEGRPIEIEPDGLPNKLNIPLSTLQFNIWYHWALAYYLKGDFEKAAELYATCQQYSTNPDLLTATSDWQYMTYRRLGKLAEAEAVLEAITPELEIIENASYFNRLLMYKGMKKPEELLDLNNTDPDQLLNIVTQGYGVGNWYLYQADTEKAKQIFDRILATSYWSAFGYIAAEADAVRMGG